MGKGGFGKVNLGIHFLTGQQYAIKKILIKNKIPANKTEEIFAEEKNLQKLRHPNIIRLYNVFKVNQVIVFLLEYLPGGDLRHYLKSKLDTKNMDDNDVFPSGLGEAEVKSIL